MISVKINKNNFYYLNIPFLSLLLTQLEADFQCFTHKFIGLFFIGPQGDPGDIISTNQFGEKGAVGLPGLPGVPVSSHTHKHTHINTVKNRICFQTYLFCGLGFSRISRSSRPYRSFRTKRLRGKNSQLTVTTMIQILLTFNELCLSYL